MLTRIENGIFKKHYNKLQLAAEKLLKVTSKGYFNKTNINELCKYGKTNMYFN